ncbi:hypothetical protein MMON_30950 [Mycolicibacterium monacense]|uniref:Uncharacterized protein n=1 Tax=Mycolicibacterium monacense TaxID=85693 RepID=A0AAD1MZN2_MYCMB|nr:hypothetical protein MMON_30950 [Mycolicibacterium monacense]
MVHALDAQPCAIPYGTQNLGVGRLLAAVAGRHQQIGDLRRDQIVHRGLGQTAQLFGVVRALGQAGDEISAQTCVEAGGGHRRDLTVLFGMECGLSGAA